MIRNIRSLHLLPFFIYPVALTWSVQHDPFFWDTVQLASKHAHFFFENGLRWLPLPEDIDSGHPPVFGFYLACIWTIFGKSLPAGHWAMLPFLLMSVWLLYRIGRRLGGEERAFWLIPLVLLDPVMAGQSVLVSPDVVLVCGFLCAVDGVLGKHRLMTAAGVLMLCLISVRGMMTATGLAVWIAVETWRSAGFQGTGAENLQAFAARFFKRILPQALLFLPGACFAAWFMWWHKQATGWIGLHPGSPWAPTFVPAKGLELVRNALVLGWRWLDFGRIFEWAAGVWLLWQCRPVLRRDRNQATLAPLLTLLICIAFFLSPSAILFKNVSAHRYALPGFIALHLLVFQWISVFLTAKAGPERPARARLILPVLVCIFAFGNLWIYPRGIAMGWDATLAHLPYHRLRAEAVAYLDANNIDHSKVGSAFPNLNTGENLLLNGDSRHFAEQDLARNDYFFASNVYNDLTDADFDTLQQHWLLLKKWQQGGVWIELYQRRQ